MLSNKNIKQLKIKYHYTYFFRPMFWTNETDIPLGFHNLKTYYNTKMEKWNILYLKKNFLYAYLTGS